MPLAEQGAEGLLHRAIEERRLRVSSDPSSVADAATVIVTIGTPADELTKPILSTFKRLADDMLPHLSDDQLVVLRSTVSPGYHGLAVRLPAGERQKTPKVSFCPERIVQGQAIEEIQLLTQIVSGTTPEAEQEAAALFRQISPRIVRLTPIEAEFAKLYSNAYRYILFATANQFYMIANAAGVDYRPGARRHEERLSPRAGHPLRRIRGGPLPAEGYDATGRLRQRRFHAGAGCHERQPGPGELPGGGDAEPVRRPARSPVSACLAWPSRRTATTPGFSLSYKLKDILAFRAREVLTTDPYVTTDPNLAPIGEVMERSDVLVLCVPHTAYRRLDLKNKPVLDIWGFLNRE